MISHADTADVGHRALKNIANRCLFFCIHACDQLFCQSYSLHSGIRYYFVEQLSRRYSRAPPDYSPDNCGVCCVWLNSFRNSKESVGTVWLETTTHCFNFSTRRSLNTREAPSLLESLTPGDARGLRDTEDVSKLPSAGQPVPAVFAEGDGRTL